MNKTKMQENKRRSLDKSTINKIKQIIVDKVKILGYEIDEKNVIYDARSYSKYNMIILVISKTGVPSLVFEYKIEQNFLNII